SDRSLRELNTRLSKMIVQHAPLEHAPRLRNVRWVRPELVCEVSFAELTREGIVRHPSFEGLREDKTAGEVGIERAQPVAKAAAKAGRNSARPARAAKITASGAPLELDGVRITHPERVMDEPSGLTKGDIARYYAAIAGRLLPYVDKRPLTLVR